MQGLVTAWSQQGTLGLAPEQMFGEIFNSFLLAHELGHYLEHMSGRLNAVDLWQSEVEANQIAIAFWEQDAGQAERLPMRVENFNRFLEGLPDPVPAGEDSRAWFIANYDGRLSTDAAAYGWYQGAFVRTAWAQRADRDFCGWVQANPPNFIQDRIAARAPVLRPLHAGGEHLEPFVLAQYRVEGSEDPCGAVSDADPGVAEGRGDEDYGDILAVLEDWRRVEQAKKVVCPDLSVCPVAMRGPGDHLDHSLDRSAIGRVQRVGAPRELPRALRDVGRKAVQTANFEGEIIGRGREVRDGTGGRETEDRRARQGSSGT